MNTGRRPNISLSGAHRRGPTQYPKRKSEVASVDISMVVPNAMAIASVALAGAVLAKVTLMVRTPQRMVMNHLYRAVQF
jgi:hypothetical protein